MSTSASVAERRGIPAAAFVEDVQTYLSQLNLDVNSALAFLQERFLLFYTLIDVYIKFYTAYYVCPSLDHCLFFPHNTWIMLFVMFVIVEETWSYWIF